jgi:hypothetical protein
MASVDAIAGEACMGSCGFEDILESQRSKNSNQYCVLRRGISRKLDKLATDTAINSDNGDLVATVERSVMRYGTAPIDYSAMIWRLAMGSGIIGHSISVASNHVLEYNIDYNIQAFIVVLLITTS